MSDENSRQPGWGARLMMGLIRGYQLILSPFFGGNCRYQPSCSHYGLEAVQVHGAVRGSWMAIKRIGRCHPWREGGYDPVPPREELTEAEGAAQ